MINKILTLPLAFSILVLTAIRPAIASDTFALTIPVREIPPLAEDTLALPRIVAQTATASAIPVTWLLNYDVLDSATSSAFFTNTNPSSLHEFGLWLDITSTFRSKHNLPQSLNPVTSHLFNSYLPAVRYQIIDLYFARYLDRFARYPATVGAPYLDALSLQYLADRYGVKAAILGLPDSGAVTIDHYFPYPYFPSKLNTLIPASKPETKINILVTFWQSLPQINVSQPPAGQTGNQNRLLIFGLDPNRPSPQRIDSFTSFINSLPSLNFPSTLISNFADHFLTYNPLTTPTYFTQTNETTTYSSPYYHLSLNHRQNKLTSLVFYNRHETEAFLFDRNPDHFLNLNTHPLISPDQPLSMPVSISDHSLSSDSVFNYSLRFGDQDLHLTPASFTTSLDLNLPPHPQYRLTSHANSFTVSPTEWRPYHTPTPKFWLDFLKLFLLVITIASILRYHPGKIIRLLKRHPATSSILILGTAAWSSTIVRSGSLTPYGLSFWGPHSHDGIFHLSLIESLKRSFYPLINPNLADAYIQNYHLLYDYALALISRLLDIPALDLYFRHLPPLLAFLIGLFGFTLLRRWRYTTAQANLSLVFLYLTGSLGFIPYFFQKGSLWGGESIFWIQQNISTLINPPFALSLLLLLLFLNLYHSWQQHLSFKRILILTLLGSLLIQAKAYASLLLLASLSAMFVFSSLRGQRPSRRQLLLFLGLITFSILFFLPTYAASGSLFHFQPLWFINSLISAQDRLNLSYLANAWQAFHATAQYPKLLTLHLFVTLLYLVGNLGVRVLALPAWWRGFFKSSTQQLVSWLILAGLVVPFIFIQSGNSWNSIQFSYYSLIFLSLLLGPVVISLINRSHTLPKFLTLSLLLIFLTLPTTIGTLKNYLSPRPSTAVTYQELRILDHLSRQPSGMVITPVHSRFRHYPYTTPLPVHASDSTAYIPALTGQPAFFANEVNLEIMNYSYQLSRQNNLRFYNTADPHFVTDFVRQNRLKYVYQTPQDRMKLENITTHFDLLFTSGHYSLLAPKSE